MNLFNHQALALLPALYLAACAPAAGTQPHDMSAADHQAAANAEEQEAAEHQGQHDPDATQVQEECAGGRGKVCWTAVTNPTDGHGKTADEHRKLAAQHRAASEALKVAEANACVGLDEVDRDVSPFAHIADIESVSQLHEEKAQGKGKVQRDAGATIVFRAAPGLTAEWLQRIVDCHLARNAAVGHDMPEMSDCPLVPKNVEAKVRSVGDGFAVDVRANDDATAAEVWRRAQLIKQGS